MHVTPASSANATSDQIGDALRYRTASIPGMTIYFQPVQDVQISTQSSRSQYQYTLTGTDAAQVSLWSQKLVAEMRRDPLFRDVSSEAQEGGLRAALNIDVAGGEQDNELSSWQLMIEHKSVDILQPDVMYLGGIHRTLEVCRMGAAVGLPITPHAANLGLVTMCTMHLLRAIPNPGKYLEFSIEGLDYYPWQDGLFLGNPYDIVDGHATVTDAPGWGVEINPAWLEKSAYKVSEIG